METKHCENCGRLIFGESSLCSICNGTSSASMTRPPAATGGGFCVRCGQSLGGLTEGFCTKCGQQIGGPSLAIPSVRSARRARPRWLASVIIAACIIVGGGAVGGVVLAFSSWSHAAAQASQAAKNAATASDDTMNTTPAATATATPPPTAQPTNTSAPTRTVTVAGATAALQTQAEAAKESAVKEGIHSLQIAVQTWAVNNNDAYPDPHSSAQLVRMLKPYVDQWPMNPYTGKPMTEKKSPGDFSYGLTASGTSYVLVGWGPKNSKLIVVP